MSGSHLVVEKKNNLNPPTLFLHKLKDLSSQNSLQSDCYLFAMHYYCTYHMKLIFKPDLRA